MTFTTLEYNGVEKPLADWLITNPQRDVTNQAADHFTFDLLAAADAVDPFPYAAKIILRLARQAAGASTTAAGLPLQGLTDFTGGAVWFVGWRVDAVRSGGPELEQISYKFDGPWGFFFERLVFQKLQLTWNGTAQVADWRSQIILGLSLTALTGAGDTVPGSTTTNLMSISQQVREIVGYAMWQTEVAYGSPQFQLDGLTQGADGVYRPDWDDAGDYKLYLTPGLSALQIPDFIAGAYATSAPANPTSANTIPTLTAPGTIALANTVLRAPQESVNDITCAEAIRHQLRWIGAMGEPVLWFDYTTNPPTLRISTRDLLPSVTLPFPAQPTIP